MGEWSGLALSQKVLENRKRQHTLVTAHKRRIRDEVNPKLRAAKRAWYDSSRENNSSIRRKWHDQKARVQGQQRSQKLKHRAAILAHKRRIRAEMARRG
jgi:hypothetical protein